MSGIFCYAPRLVEKLLLSPGRKKEFKYFLKKRDDGDYRKRNRDYHVIYSQGVNCANKDCATLHYTLSFPPNPLKKYLNHSYAQSIEVI